MFTRFCFPLSLFQLTKAIQSGTDDERRRAKVAGDMLSISKHEVMRLTTLVETLKHTNALEADKAQLAQLQ